MENKVHLILIKNKIDYDISLNYKLHILSETGKLSKIRFINNYLLLNKLKKIINNEEKIKRFDLIISNLTDSDKLCSQLNHKNLYFCIRNSESSKLKGKSILKKYRVLNRYKNKNLITVSNGLQNDILNTLKIKPKSIRTIYNPFYKDKLVELSNEYTIEEDEEYIVHVGRFTKQKRHDILLKAYAKSGIQEKLILIGDYSGAESVIALIDELDINDKVILKGFIKNPYPYIKNAKCLVLSSDFEGLPGVLLEALFLNTIIVSTDCPSGPNEILINELSGFLSPIGDIEALSINIKNAILNPVKITDKFTSRFDSKVVLEQYLILCNN
jgi:glycosyltransferase involved in cell wall biosynthesis